MYRRCIQYNATKGNIVTSVYFTLETKMSTGERVRGQQRDKKTFSNAMEVFACSGLVVTQNSCNVCRRKRKAGISFCTAQEKDK